MVPVSIFHCAALTRPVSINFLMAESWNQGDTVSLATAVWLTAENSLGSGCAQNRKQFVRRLLLGAGASPEVPVALGLADFRFFCSRIFSGLPPHR